jgi:hypothetical protein
VDLGLGFMVGGVGFDRLEFGIDRLKWKQLSIEESYAEQLKPLSEKDFALCHIEQGKI